MTRHPPLTELHNRALADATTTIDALSGPAWQVASRCPGWDRHTLVAHLVGQNLGFAAALRSGSAPVAAYQPAHPDRWHESVTELTGAAAQPAATVELAEVAPGRPLDPDTVVRIHLLDTVIHSWDLDQRHRPDAALIDLAAQVATMVPAERPPASAFAAPVPHAGEDPWLRTLAWLGRDPAE